MQKIRLSRSLWAVEGRVQESEKISCKGKQKVQKKGKEEIR